MRRCWRSAYGITLVEATVVLAVVALLTAAAAPSAARTIQRARLVRVVTDEEAIKTAIVNFLTDMTGNSQGQNIGFTIEGIGNQNGTPVDILVSDGDIPAIGSGGTEWDDPVNNTTGLVDFLERHLVTNNPRGDVANDYSTTVGNNGYWRGAYLNGPVDPDPWGNRYAVNTQRLITSSRDVDVIVLSAGPDEEIDTAYNINRIKPGEDDILVIVRRDPGRTVP
ncbi:MAG: hypothetical protein HYU37_12870 [Acidobacteria bacterium]|nr:hypothetical protein [Acidobacteriota bacterium]